MATFVLIHGAGDVGWYWHLVEAELRERGHDTVAPDLPCDDDSAGLSEYVDAVVQAMAIGPTSSWWPSRSVPSRPRLCVIGCP
jgi:pimeloyl-ACP methyl ester carboxylesterase